MRGGVNQSSPDEDWVAAELLLKSLKAKWKKKFGKE